MTVPSESQHIRASGEAVGIRKVASPQACPLQFIEFSLVHLTPEAPRLSWESAEREAVLYLLGGACDFEVASGPAPLAGALDSRPSIFEGPPSALFVPAGARLAVEGRQVGARLALFSAPSAESRPPKLVGPGEATARQVGSGAFLRTVTSVVDQHTASRLLVGETLNRPGGWSSYPPHKHDALSQAEAPMEEVYHYLLRPQGGFGLQMVYTQPDDPAPFQRIYRVRDGDTVIIPRGYHPLVAGGGYELAYLWAISGARVQYAAWADDPDHAWINRPG